MGKKSFLSALVFTVLFSGCGYIQTKRVPLTETQAAPAATPAFQMGDWLIARGALHNHTTYSDGCRTPADLVQEARNEGMAVLSFNDHREGRLCLGKHICLDMGGVDVKKRGYDRYFDEIEKLARESSNPVILTGLEVGPYFWNEGTAPYYNIKAVHWHFSTYGIDDREIYKNMPARMNIAVKPEPDPGVKPYNEWVEYLVAKGGMIFQAHPESFDFNQYGPVMMIAPPPILLTDKLPGLTGVAVTPEGFVIVARPGGEWDRAQLQYLAGLRKAPLWGWGEVDYHCVAGLGLRSSNTWFYLKELGRAEVLKAMKTGMMVAFMGEDFQEIYVTEFSVGDGRASADKIMLGQEVRISGAPVVRFSMNKPAPEMVARLIRSGKVVHETKSEYFEFRDEAAGKLKDRVFYRVEVEGRGPMEIVKGNRLFTNPIFVSWSR